MGWWSTTIMGGDTPLDLECMIYEILGIEMYSPKRDIKRKIPKDKFTERQNEIVEKLVELEDGWEKDTVGLQVLGVMMMEVGAKINRKNKELILKAARKDEWAKGDLARKTHIKNFISALKSYTGRKPVLLPTETLGQVFAKH